MKTRIIKAGLQPPQSATVMITNRCNLHCAHCWPESSRNSSSGPVSAYLVKRLIRDLARLSVEEICITGGEPFTHPSLPDLISYCRQQSPIKRICIQTNGTLFNAETLRSLNDIDFPGLTVQVSLDGASAKTNDRLRGGGNFEKTLAGLELLTRHNLGRRTRIVFTEMRHNMDELPDLLKLAGEMGLGSVISSTLVKQGRAARQQYCKPPAPDQYRSLLSRFQKDRSFRSRYLAFGNIAALEWLSNRNAPSPEACRCIRDLYITVEGRIYPCIMMRAEKYAVTGLYDRSLDDALLAALPLWSGLPALDRQRRKQLRQCTNCAGSAHCGGGCMGRAYAATGGFFSEEDRCGLRKVVYNWDCNER